MKARMALIALTISIGQFSPFHLTDTLTQTRTGVASCAAVSAAGFSFCPLAVLLPLSVE